jgi:hypothetical protein
VRGARRGIVAPALAVLAALALYEAVSRFVYWLPDDVHPQLGSVLREGARVVYCREGCGASHWIADGIRRATPLDRAQPVILALGDSFTESLMTDDGAVYTRLAEDQLSAAGAFPQIANAGRSGASAADYVAQAPFWRAALAPRWTTVQLRARDVEGDAFDSAKNHFVRTPSGGIRLVAVERPPSGLNRYLAPLRRRSALASFTSIRAFEFVAAARAEPPMFRATARPPAPVVTEYPIEAQLDALAAAWDGRITFLFLPEYDARDPDAAGETERRVIARCAARAWSCANLRDRFADFATTRTSPYGFANSSFNAGHMNDAGHAATAAVLAEELERLRARDLF